MADQDSSLITTPAAVETSETPSPEWLAVHRTTAEELATANWMDGRTQDVAANKIIRQEMGLAYESYKEQLDGLSTKERMALIDSSADEIVAELDKRAAGERERKNQAEQAEKQAREREDTGFGETPGLRQVRHAVGSAYREAVSLDKKIEKLHKFNEMVEDPAAKGWDDQPAELWRKAREGTLERVDGEIANLTQEKQARLQEAAFHQVAYHESARAMQPAYAPPPNMPVNQVVGDNGQPMAINPDDRAQIEQMDRAHENYEQLANETAKRYPDWHQAFVSAARSGVFLTPGQVEFIAHMANGPEVGYHLAKHPDDRGAIGRMSSRESQWALTYISQQLALASASASYSAPAERRTTQAPKPPSPVGGGSSRVWSPYDEGGSNEEWAHRRYQDLKRRGKAS